MHTYNFILLEIATYTKTIFSLCENFFPSAKTCQNRSLDLYLFPALYQGKWYVKTTSDLQKTNLTHSHGKKWQTILRFLIYQIWELIFRCMNININDFPTSTAILRLSCDTFNCVAEIMEKFLEKRPDPPNNSTHFTTIKFRKSKCVHHC